MKLKSKKIENIFKLPEKGVRGLISFKKPGMGQISYLVLLFIVFGLPLFPGIGRTGSLGLDKQAFLIVFAFAGLAFFVLERFTKDRIGFNFSILHLLSLVFVALFLFSTLTAKWSWGSFWGWPQEGKENLLTLLGFFIFFVSLSQLVSKKKVALFLKIALVSGVIKALAGIMYLFGGPGSSPLLSNMVGDPNQMVSFLVSLIPIGLILGTRARKKAVKILYYAAVLLFVMVMLGVNYKLAWTVLFAGMIPYLLLILWAEEKNQRIIVFPAVLFALGLSFGILGIRAPQIFSPPVQITPSFKATLDVSLEMIKGSARNWMLGWGPGSFKYGWSRFKSADLNRTPFWGTRVPRGGSEILERLGTLGIAGAGAQLLLILLGLWQGGKGVFQKKKKEDWLIRTGVVSGFVALSSVKLLSVQNTTLGFLWWMFLGLIVVLEGKGKKVSFPAASRPGLLFFLAGVLVLIGSGFLLYLEGTRYAAEIIYAESWTKDNIEEVEKTLTRAIRINPEQEVFWRDLSVLYLKRVQGVDPSVIQDSEQRQRVTGFVYNSLKAAEEATRVNPHNVINWQAKGQINQNLMNWSSLSFDGAVSSYNRALELEPDNPYLLVELGKTYLSQARLNKDEDKVDSFLKKGEQKFRRALQVKPDYAPASYQLSILYQTEGRTEEAIATLENLKQMRSYISDYNPMRDVGLAFQLGMLYYGEGRLDKARAELERAVELDQNYSNALYFLGLTYDRQGEKEKAIAQFEKVERLNPDNAMVKQILSNLRQGKRALPEEGMPEELPIKQEPEEVSAE